MSITCRFWYTRFDILGGLERLNILYEQYVISVYTHCLSIHVAAFVLTCVIMLSYLVVVLRPFLNKISCETRRIAELLSQLPPDIDVEGLLTRMLPRPKQQV
jgi:hypothetical protein